MAQTFNTILSFVKSTSRKDRRKGVDSLSVSAVAGGGVGSAADSATQAWVRDNFVDKTTEQEISALKIFSQGIKIGDVSLFKHPDGYVYLDETLVLKGGVVMYGNTSDVDVPSIFDSLPIDGRTIKRDGNGALYVDETALSISGGGGGVADSVYWNNVIGKPSWIGSTKPSYTYSEISGTPDLSVYFLKTSFTKDNIKNTLGISDWALASAKPTYTASEVGALRLNESSANADLDTILDSKTAELKPFFQALTTNDVGSARKGVLRISYNGSESQLLFDHYNRILRYRTIGSSPKSWKTLAFTDDIPTKLSQLTDDVVSGKYLPLSGGTINGSITATSFIGNLTGNADSATESTSTHRFKYVLATNGCDLNSILTGGGILYNYGSQASGYIVNAPSGYKYGSCVQFQSHSDSADNGLAGQLFWDVNHVSETDATRYLYWRAADRNGWTYSKWHQIAFTDSNVASATKLANTVSLWGQSFDGTKDVTGAITVDGDASFSSKLVIGGISLRKVDNYLYLDSSLVLSGGVTMYGDDGTTVKPIWESIPLDSSTLAWLDGKLSVIGGVGSGGGISEEFLNKKLEDYALQSWVDNKGYLLETTASNTYQPKITSSSKLAYSLISGTPDLSVYFLKTSFTKDNIKSTLGISDWALASAKPTYTASEVGALRLNESSANADLDTILDSKTAELKPFFQALTTNDVGSARKGVLRISYNGSESQLLFDHYNRILRYRTIGSSPKSWKTLAFTDDIPTKLSQLTDDVVSGKYLPLRGGTLTDALTVKGSGSPLTVHRTQSLASVVKFVNTDGVLGWLGVDVDKTAIFMTASSAIKKLLHSGNYSEYALPLTGGTINGSITASSFIGNLTGNANSATKLATARTIWGQSFDGTADITGDMTIPNNNSIKVKSSGGVVYSVLKMSTANSLSIGQESASNGRTTMIYGNLIRLRCGTGGTDALYVNASGNVTIGASDLAGASNKLFVDGTAKFDGDATFSKHVVIGTIPVYESADGTLYVDANVVFRGGVAMFGNTTTTINEE